MQVPFGLVAASSTKPTETPPDSLYQECVALNQQKLVLKYAFDGGSASLFVVNFSCPSRTATQWLRWFTRYETPPFTNKPRCVCDVLYASLLLKRRMPGLGECG